MRRSKRWVQAAVLAPLLGGGPVRAEVGGGLFLSVVFGAEGEAWRFAPGWGESPVVLPPPPALRAPLVGESGLVRLAVESWLDGCLGEGRAALEAEEAARRAHDPAARRIQGMIAQDEARHAELAWQVVDWALARGGRRVQGALRAERATGGASDGERSPEGRSEPRTLRAVDGDAPPSMPSIEVPDSAVIFGQLSVRHIAALAHHQQAAARRRLGSLLG